jgi:Uma2 family endonuclease
MSEAAATLTNAPPPDDVPYEVIDGEIVEKPPMGAREGLFATKLILWLSRFGGIERFGQLASEVLFKLHPAGKRSRRPDVAFISFERWPGDRLVPPGDDWDVVPDLAIEVISPTNSAIDVVKKLNDYFRAGVRLVWVVYPVQRLFYSYRSPTEVRILGPDDELEGDPVLPGVRLPVRALLGDVPDAEAEGA